MSRPLAFVVEECNSAGATWWTLYVGGIAKPSLSISYRTKGAALADAPLWCALGIEPQLRIEVIPLVRNGEAVAV